MKKFHILKLYYTKPHRIKIVSELYATIISMSITQEHNTALDMGLAWCKENGFDIVGISEVKGFTYLISNTLKKP